MKNETPAQDGQEKNFNSIVSPQKDPFKESWPQAVAAEAAVLGAILNHGNEALSQAKSLRVEHMYSSQHRLIYGACLALARDGIEPDVVTVPQWLKDRDALLDAGGQSYINELTIAEVRLGLMDSWIQQIQEAYQGREMLIMAHDLASEVQFNPDYPKEQIIKTFKDRVEGIIQTRPTLPKGVTALELMGMDFPPIKWIIPGLLPEGLTLLAGPPKIGKSWLAMAMVRAVAHGGYCLSDQPVQQGEALYIALEDGGRRLKSRLEKLADGVRENNNLTFLTSKEIKRADNGGMDTLTTWLDDHPRCCLVIIDTLQRFRPRSRSKTVGYDDDYIDAMVPLQEMAIERGIGVVYIHHLRKMEASDQLDRVSGTTGLTGGADSVWVLTRPRGEADGRLSITGRDVEEQDLALHWDQVDCRWSVTGQASEVAASKAEGEVLAVFRGARGPLSIKEVAEELGAPYERTKKRLQNLAKNGKLTREDKKYILSSFGETGKRGENGVSPTQSKVVSLFPAVGETGKENRHIVENSSEMGNGKKTSPFPRGEVNPHETSAEHGETPFSPTSPFPHGSWGGPDGLTWIPTDMAGLSTGQPRP